MKTFKDFVNESIKEKKVGDSIWIEAKGGENIAGKIVAVSGDTLTVKSVRAGKTFTTDLNGNEK